MRETLVDPSGSMLPFNKPVSVVTQAGDTVTGRRLNEDTYTIQILDEEERLRSFDKADLRELTVLATSPMPSYADLLTDEELADVLAYLVDAAGTMTLMAMLKRTIVGHRGSDAAAQHVAGSGDVRASPHCCGRAAQLAHLLRNLRESTA